MLLQGDIYSHSLLLHVLPSPSICASSGRVLPSLLAVCCSHSRPCAAQELTPLDRAAKLSDALGSEVLLKREDLQPVR